MTFASLTFFVFFPAIFVLYWLVKHRTRQNVLLIFASYCFYGWWDYRFCALMVISSLLDFVVGRALGRTEQARSRRALLWCSIAGNLGLLGVFKYYGFFVESMQSLASGFGWQLNFGTLEIILPVGISFYTFQTLSYTIDIYRRKIEPTPSLIDYLAFVSFFPQLVAGPIERAANLLPQMSKPRQFDYQQANDGCRLILWGLFKKMVIADRLSVIVDRIYAAPDTSSGPEFLLAAVCFVFQIYCDFSAYSDIAIGTAKLFNIRLMRNFAYPLFSQSISEFWQRWHISMTSWFRDYVFVPLSRRRSRPLRLASLVATFLISGLWHGAAWTFVVWGGFNGLLLIGAKVFSLGGARKPSDTPGGEQLIPSPPVLARITLTFLAVSLMAVFFRAASVLDGIAILGKILTTPFSRHAIAGMSDQIAMARTETHITMIALAGFVLAEWIQRRHEHPIQFERCPVAIRWSVYSMAIWGSLLLMPTTFVNPFIYFRF